MGRYSLRITSISQGAVICAFCNIAIGIQSLNQGLMPIRRGTGYGQTGWTYHKMQ